MRTITMLLCLMCSTAAAQDSWRTAPGYPHGGGAVHTVYVPQAEFRPTTSYYLFNGRLYVHHANVFTGRVTVQSQRRQNYHYTSGGVTYDGWFDPDYYGW